MILGIDSSNLRSGGTVCHLVEVLRAARPLDYGFSKVVVWGEKSLLEKIEPKEWLVKKYEKDLDLGLFKRLKWQFFMAGKLAEAEGCDLRLTLSGIDLSRFSPVVTCSHNALPFEWDELRRYGFSWQTIRNLLLRLIQSYSFKKADGMIFTSEYSKKIISNVVEVSKSVVILHGIHQRFRKDIIEYEDNGVASQNEFNLLYVSTIDLYKHQWHVVRSVAKLRSEGYNVKLKLVGGAFRPALKKLEEVMRECDPHGEYCDYLGLVDHNELPDIYKDADLFVFASSCETMPNILLEAMGAGLPVVSSNKGPMREVLKDYALYFDPEDYLDIADQIRVFLDNRALLSHKARLLSEESENYSWDKCANLTFDFLRKVITEKS